MEIQPFVVDVPQPMLDDLQERLARTRWPDEVGDAGWDYGTNLASLQALVEYWRTRFDWRGQERAMNALPHFRAEVDGIGIHFIHARGHGPAPLPLLITHGWPSSFVEMLELIPLMADPGVHGGGPADAFDGMTSQDDRRRTALGEIQAQFEAIVSREWGVMGPSKSGRR